MRLRRKQARISILIVDEVRRKRRRLAMSLAAPEREVVAAANVADALEILERRSIDLVVSTYSLGDGDAVDLLQAIRGRNALQPFVIAGGDIPHAAVEAALSQDAYVIDADDSLGEVVALLAAIDRGALVLVS